MYRRGPMPEHHKAETYNGPGEPQFEGVVFTDGTVAIRWLTTYRSVSVWTRLEDMMEVHGHPEYGSELVWHDAEPEDEMERLAQLHRDRWASEKEGESV